MIAPDNGWSRDTAGFILRELGWIALNFCAVVFVVALFAFAALLATGCCAP